MLDRLQGYTAHTYAAMRIVVGFLFLWHGSEKWFGFPNAGPDMPAAIRIVGGGIELLGGALVMIGLFTRESAFLCSGMMAVAYWIAHGTHALLPISNHGEPAALYCFVFLFIAAKGGGLFSIDEARGRRR